MNFLPPAGIVSVFHGIEYYIPAKAWKFITEDNVEQSFETTAINALFTLAIVFHFGDDERISLDSLMRHINSYYAKDDDVFNVSFLSHIIILAPKATIEPQGNCDLAALASSLSDYLGVAESHQGHPRTQVKEITVTSKLEAPKGPHFLTNGNLHQAWRCYDDPIGAFTTSVVPSLLEKDS